MERGRVRDFGVKRGKKMEKIEGERCERN